MERSMSKQEQSTLFPTYARFPVTMVRGEGSRLWDDQGKEYLDFMTGIAVVGLGHNHPKVKAKVAAQLDQLWHTSNLFHHPNHEELGSLLTRVSGLDRVFFANSGAEANEGAIKLARRYQQKIKGTSRYEVITFRQSFHGRTLATLTATGQDKVKDGFGPLPQGFVTVPYNDVEALRGAIGPNTGAVMLELVQGEGGVNPADPAFVKAAAELCREHGLLLIVDEIQTGIGRTGRWFAFQHYGIEPDIVTVAKGLGNGLPIGAVLGRAELTDAFAAGTHGTTFGGNPVATAAAIAVLETIEEEGILQQAAETGAWMLDALRRNLAGNAFVRDVRGLGMILGIECAEPVADLVSAAREQGLLVISAGPNVIRLLPSLNISRADAERGVNVLTSLLAAQAVSAV
jgi:acetylornithine aminotransferase